MPRINDVRPPIDMIKHDLAPPKEGALLIKALDEIFLPDIPFKEKQRLLINLNKYLQNKTKEPETFPVFFEIGKDYTLDQLLLLINQFLPKKNEITNFLCDQITDDYDFESFLEDCHSLDVKTIVIGGVYGDSCVWAAAVKRGANIFAKKLGVYHPNVRFVDDEGGKQFDNAVILPELTEGQGEGIFDSFICFTQLKSFPVPLTPRFFERAEEKLKREKPEEIGLDYMKNYAPRKKNHSLLLTKIQDIMTSSSLSTSSSSSSQLEDEKKEERIIDPIKEKEAPHILLKIRNELLSGRASLSTAFREQQRLEASNNRYTHNRAVSAIEKKRSVSKARAK